jgi:simple sugar transport system substrate-binding protein
MDSRKVLRLLTMAALGAATVVVAHPPQARAAAPTHYVFALITHGQTGAAFWDVVRRGAQAAAANHGAKLIYLPDPTESGEARLVTNALQQHVDGIAITLAFPLAMAPVVKQAEEENVPVIAVNAGANEWQKMGMLGYVGTEEIASGMSVGNRLNKAGAKNVVCLDHQQGAIQLEQRCDGIKKTFAGKVTVLYVPGLDMASAQSRMLAKLQQDPTVDFIVTLDSSFVPATEMAIKLAGSKAKTGTFGIDGLTIKSIERGTVDWAVDIQPWLQGYEAIDLLYLNKANGNQLGGGGPVLTGPSYVTRDNANDIAKFASEGTR